MFVNNVTLLSSLCGVCWTDERTLVSVSSVWLKSGGVLMDCAGEHLPSSGGTEWEILGFSPLGWGWGKKPHIISVWGKELGVYVLSTSGFLQPLSPLPVCAF